MVYSGILTVRKTNYKDLGSLVYDQIELTQHAQDPKYNAKEMVSLWY